jgi:tRNA threonylcarbamoyladenosine biosynthesis protein TsaE
MEWQKNINTLNQLFELAHQISRVIAAGDIVFLTGDLGAGKTTFCQALFRALGYDQLVKSPTYTLVEPYLIAGQDYFHFDLYRVRDPMELYSMGVDDYFKHDSVVLIEWPEKAEGALPAPTLTLNFSMRSEDCRLVYICTDDGKYVDLFKRMNQDDH